MVRRHWLSIVLIAASSWLPLSCTTSVYRDVYPTLVDGEYDSEFPYRGCSDQLQAIGETVYRISTIAYYRRYPFASSEGVRFSDITQEALDAHEKDAVYFNNTYSGTATVIAFVDRKAALLTCAHVVHFPDTIVTYYIDQEQRLTDIVTAVAVKVRESVFAAGLPSGGELELLAIDYEGDLALLGSSLPPEAPPSLRVFPYPLGKARDLEWGSFLYLFGYPSGYKMVTKGIVSSPNKDKRGSFLIDAVFNRGFSGGLVLAIRDGVPNFELVGIVKMVSGHSMYTLIPERREDNTEYDLAVPYKGEVYVDKRTELEYGVTQAISAEQVREFLTRNRETLLRRGYSLTSFLGPS